MKPACGLHAESKDPYRDTGLASRRSEPGRLCGTAAPGCPHVLLAAPRAQLGQLESGCPHSARGPAARARALADIANSRLFNLMASLRIFYALLIQTLCPKQSNAIERSQCFTQRQLRIPQLSSCSCHAFWASFHGPLSGRADPRREENEYGVRASPFRTTLPGRYVAAWRCISQDSGKFCGPSCHWSRQNHDCSRLDGGRRRRQAAGWPAPCAQARHAGAENSSFTAEHRYRSG